MCEDKIIKYYCSLFLFYVNVCKMVLFHDSTIYLNICFHLKYFLFTFQQVTSLSVQLYTVPTIVRCLFNDSNYAG